MRCSTFGFASVTDTTLLIGPCLTFASTWTCLERLLTTVPTYIHTLTVCEKAGVA